MFFYIWHVYFNRKLTFDWPARHLWNRPQVTGTTKLAIKKDVFLSNTRSKQIIIRLSPEIVVKEGFKTIHTPDDTGTLIACTALS